MDVMVIVECMSKLLIIMLLGMVLYKFNIIDSDTGKKLSSLVVKITAPLLIISSALSASRENRGQILILFGAGFLMYIGFMIFAKLVTALLRFNKKERPLFECMMVFANNSFMGFPVLQSVLGDGAVFYSSMLHFSFNIFIYTYAVVCLKKACIGDNGAVIDTSVSASGNVAADDSDKSKRINSSDNKVISEEKKSLKEKTIELIKCLISPGFILILSALVIYLVGIRDDGVVYETCYMIGNMTSPLSMLVLGVTFAQYPIKESLTDIRCYGFSLIRLFLIPSVTYGICRLINVNDYYTSIVTITNAMPVASMVLMMANEYKIDTRIIIRNIVVTTLLSLFTIPVVVMIFLA